MEKTTIEFQHNSRTTYAAIKRLFEKQTKFSGIHANDEFFIIEARHGAWISPFSESIRMKVVAMGSNSCRVNIESSSRSIFNLLNIGANKSNLADLKDYINNEVYKLQDIKVNAPCIKLRS